MLFSSFLAPVFNSIGTTTTLVSLLRLSGSPSRLGSSLRVGSLLDSAAARPQVALTDGTGTVEGISSSAGLQQDYFLGVPYAQAPVGSLRFAKPAMLGKNSSMIDASTWGKSCPQSTSQQLKATSMSEDCLVINVMRPSSVPSDAKLPVVVWVYGGSFISGDSSLYNGSALVLQSMMQGQPTIFTSFNYRLGPFGFLASDEVASSANGSSSTSSGAATLNAGLYDAEAALLWLQRNIGAFGGDPAKVTVIGQSAGAFLIGALLLADSGKAVGSQNLFRAAILESGATTGIQVPPPSVFNVVYASLASNAGCKEAPALDCLRSASAATLLQAGLTTAGANSQEFDFLPVLDGYFHQEAASVSLAAGRVAIVPAIIGNNLDEGTIFTPTTIAEASGLSGYFESTYYIRDASNATTALTQLLSLYPDDPTQGSPYNSSTPSDRIYGTTNQYKRLASIVGDMWFQSGRRALMQFYSSNNADANVYSYLFNTPTPSAQPALGIYHGSEITYVYGSYADQNITSSQGLTSAGMLKSWIAFASTLSPNGNNLPTWPKYGSSAQMLEISLSGVTSVITDDYRKDGMAFLQSTQWTSPLYL